MPNRYSRAVVVGATMSGLLAARALAECGNTERRQRQNAERACARRFTPDCVGGVAGVTGFYLDLDRKSVV